MALGLPTCSNGTEHIHQSPWSELPRLYEVTTAKDSVKRCSCTYTACKTIISGLLTNGRGYCTMRICSEAGRNEVQKEVFVAHHKLLEHCLEENTKKKPWRIKNFHFHAALLSPESSFVHSYIHNKQLAMKMYGEQEDRYRVGVKYPQTWFVVPTELVVTKEDIKACSHSADNCCSSLSGENLFLPPPPPTEDCSTGYQAGLPRLYEKSAAASPTCSCLKSVDCDKCMIALHANRPELNHCPVKICSGGSGSKAQKIISSKHQELLFRLIIGNDASPKKKTSAWIINSIHFHPLVRETESGSVQSYIYNRDLARHLYGGKEGIYQVGDSYPNTWFIIPTQFVISSDYKGTSMLSLQLSKTAMEQEDQMNSYHVDDCTLKSLCANVAATSDENKVYDDAFETNQTFIVSEDEDDDDSRCKTMPRERVKELRGHLIALVKNASSSLPNSSSTRAMKYLEESTFLEKTPEDYHKTMAHQLDACIFLLARVVSHMLLPNNDPEEATRYFSEVLARKTAKLDKGKKSSQNDDAILSKIGKQLAEIAGAKSGATSQMCIKRRPLMSICASVTSRVKMQELTDVKISKYEWEKARIHCIFPGPGEPVEKRNVSRVIVPNETLITFTTWLKTKGYIQDLAYGHKVITYRNGRQVPIAAVKIASGTRINIIRDYFSEIVEKVAQSEHPEWYLASHDDYLPCAGTNDAKDPSDSICCLPLNHDGPHMFRCKARCSKISVRCLKEQGHQGQHKYTPSSETLSFTSCDLILKKITSGTMKSLAGLDDIDTNKGTENFRRMRSMADILSSIARVNVTERGRDRISLLHQEINDTELYHKVEFSRHLDLKLEGKCKNMCACVRCGFSLDGQKIEPCPLHEAGEHIGPCNKCQKSFEIISELYNLFEEARNVVGERSSKEMDLTLMDDLERWEDELAEVRRDLEDYRAHLVFKYDERFFIAASNFLKEVKAKLGYDFKMRMLEAYHRESKKMWYAKRGITNLGYCVKTQSKLDLTQLSTEYHMFLSNYTTQSADFSNRAKQVLYNDILKPRGLDSLVTVFDGGGHFRGNDSKAFMAISDTLTGVHENRLIQFPPGDGKDDCDRVFATLGHHLRRLVQSGNSYRDARDIVRLLILHPLPANIFVHHFEPDFSFPLLQVPDSAKLAGYYNVKNEPEKKGVLAKVHSRHSIGDFIPYEDIMPSIVDAPSPAPTQKIENIDNADANTMADRIKSFSKMDGQQPGESSIYDGVDLEDAAAYFDFLDQFNHHFEDPNLPSSIKMSNYPFHNAESIRNNKTYSPLPGQVRAITAMRDEIGKREERFMKKEESMRERLSTRGLHKCTERDMFGSFCIDFFCTKAKLDKHVKQGNHTFPFEDISSRATATTLAGQSKLQLDLDKITNRSDAHAAQNNLPIIISASEKFDDKRIGSDWYKRGCYSPRNKRGKEGAKRKSYAMLCDLELIYQAGDSRSSDSAKPNANKFKPNEAATYLSNLLDEDGRRKYRRNGKYGNLLKAEQIKAWMGGRHSGKIAPIILGKDEFENYSTEELKGECQVRGLSPGKKQQIFEILELYDEILMEAVPAITMAVSKEAAKLATSMINDSLVDKYSASTTKEQLKEMFSSRKLPYFEPGSKKSLLLLLRMDRVRRKDGPPNPPPVKQQISAMNASITSTNEVASQIRAEECKYGSQETGDSDSDSDIDIDIDIESDIYNDGSIDDSASADSNCTHGINIDIEEDSTSNTDDNGSSCSSFDSTNNYSFSSDSSEELSLNDDEESDATSSLFKFENIGNVSIVSEHSSHELDSQSVEQRTLISISESEEGKSHSKESSNYSSIQEVTNSAVARKPNSLPALEVLARHPEKHIFDSICFDSVTATFSCNSCKKISDISMVLICDIEYYEHCKNSKRLMWETRLLYAFGLLQLHQAHRDDIYFIDCSTPQQDIAPATTFIKANEMHKVLTIAHGNNHFVILSFDVKTKTVSVYDGCGYDLHTWDDHCSFIFRKIGVQGGNKWKKKLVQKLRGREVKQSDGWNCGPIACMVLWGLMHPSEEFDDAWNQSVITFRKTITEKMKLLTKQNQNVLNVNRTVRWLSNNKKTSDEIKRETCTKKTTKGKNTKPCSCKKGCNKRCGCLKNNLVCGEKCGCRGLCGR